MSETDSPDAGAGADADMDGPPYPKLYKADAVLASATPSYEAARLEVAIRYHVHGVERFTARQMAAWLNTTSHDLAMHIRALSQDGWLVDVGGLVRTRYRITPPDEPGEREEQEEEQEEDR